MCSALTTCGCEHGKNAADIPAEWGTPLTISSAPIACPRADAAARREFSRTVAAPEPDTTDPKTGAPMVSLGRMKDKVDEFRKAVDAKNTTGRRVIREGDRCAGEDQVAAKAVKASKGS